MALPGKYALLAFICGNFCQPPGFPGSAGPSSSGERISLRTSSLHLWVLRVLAEWGVSSFPAGRTLLIQANISLGSSQLHPGDTSVNMGVSTASTVLYFQTPPPFLPKALCFDTGQKIHITDASHPVINVIPTETLKQNQSQRTHEVHRVCLRAYLSFPLSAPLNLPTPRALKPPGSHTTGEPGGMGKG